MLCVESMVVYSISNSSSFLLVQFHHYQIPLGTHNWFVHSPVTHFSKSTKMRKHCDSNATLTFQIVVSWPVKKVTLMSLWSQLQPTKNTGRNTSKPLGYHVFKIGWLSVIDELPCDQDSLKSSRDQESSTACLLFFLRKSQFCYFVYCCNEMEITWSPWLHNKVDDYEMKVAETS